MAGLKLSVRILNLLTLGKVMALAAIVVGAWTFGFGSLSHFEPFLVRRPGAPPLREALGLGLIGAFYSFGGFWEVSRVAGEIRDARRALPRALTVGVAAVTAIYLLTTLSFLYLVPPDQVTSASEFARRAGEALAGRSGAALFAGVVVLSVIASAMALLVMAPRVYLAMSRDGLFPAALASLHPRTKAPARATAVMATIASVFVLSGSFPQVVALFLCPTLAFIALAAAGLLRLRRREPDGSAFCCPGSPATPLLFFVFVLGVILLVALARPFPALLGFALVLAGLPFYRIVAEREVAAATKNSDGGSP
jgi:APA family basic amino acid/polyamine antiporter